MKATQERAPATAKTPKVPNFVEAAPLTVTLEVVALGVEETEVTALEDEVAMVDATGTTVAVGRRTTEEEMVPTTLVELPAP
jgi:hypothetical protein